MTRQTSASSAPQVARQVGRLAERGVRRGQPQPRVGLREGVAMQTRLTDLLQIEHPVMLAGMGGVSYNQVVAAVSEAGGFGCLGASTMSTPQMVAEMKAVRELTDKPFGVDLLTAMPGDMPAQVEKVIA